MARMRSSARRSLTRIPARAETEVEIEITSGIARPSAWGHAMTSTVTAATTPASGDPTRDQMAMARRAVNVAR